MARILVIEDEAMIRANLCRMLAIEGYAVIEAADGVTGATIAAREKPDLVLCDVMMPGLDGFEVLRRLRADPATAGVPFVFVTASADKHDKRFGLDLGADDYVTKPFDMDHLLQVIARRLARP